MIQLQFLNYILTKQDASILSLNNIDKSYFSDYEKEYEYIKEHIDKYGNVPDTLTFIEKFSDFDLIEVHETQTYLIDSLYEDKNKRMLAKVFNNIRNLLNDGKTDEAMNMFSNMSANVSKAKHLETVDLLTDMSRYDDYIERTQDFNKFYVKTGFDELDKIIGGWDRTEELATIVARSNQGKSWLLIKSAVASLQQGLRVGIYSGEMSPRKVGYRFDTLDGHISNSGLVRGKDGLQNEYKRYLENLKDKYPNGCMKILTPDMINGPAGITALKAFIEKENLDILMVDQHSLLEDDRHGRSPVEKASNISRDLKNLQVMKHIPIITVSQQNRESTENGVGLEHIAQSDRIAQDSTVVIFFERNKENNNIMTLHLTKSRDSVNMKDLSYVVDFDKGLFQYIPEEDNALGGMGADELRAEYEEDNF